MRHPPDTRNYGARIKHDMNKTEEMLVVFIQMFLELSPSVIKRLR